MSLRDLAIRRLAILRGETGDETESETAKQNVACVSLGPQFAEAGETHLARKSAIPATCFTVSPSRQRNSETTLPKDLVRALERLRTSCVPIGIAAQVWKGVVRDADELASQGWAAKALQFGWSSLDLFGAVTQPDGDPAGDGLAVRLAGRRLLAICEGFATVEDPGGGRSYLHRGDTSGARLLWELANG